MKKRKSNIIKILIIVILSVIAIYSLLPNEENIGIVENISTTHNEDNGFEDKNINNERQCAYVNKEIFGDAKYLICIHKLSYKLDVYVKDLEKPMYTFPIAVAKNDGDKQRPGDNRTPISWGNVVEIPSKYKGADIGVKSTEVPFVVEEICDSSTWVHDFNDGKGTIEGAYGPWFISLDTGWEGIGIHGTHDPNSIGTNASEGCIRLLNEDIITLKNLIYSDNEGIGTKVIIAED